MTVRVGFLGTPEIAVPALHACADRFDVAVVVTQPDRPRGRSRRPVPPPIKQAAAERGLPVAQPETAAGIAGALGSAGPLDLALLVAYGRVVRSDALAVPTHGIVNAHFSLLPRWRGAAPVQRALMAGDARTGVSVMVLDEGLDTGPVVAIRSTAVGSEEDAGTLSSRLAEAAAGLLPGTAEAWARGEVVATAQPAEGATTATKLGPADRVIAWERPAREVRDLVRALAPAPGAVTPAGETTLKILAVGVVAGEGEPGHLLTAADGPVVACGDGAVRLDRVQPAGGRAMTGSEWARGLRQTIQKVG